ncbi:hypothetical protein TNCV_789401 [Trichonephila clavipes]|nr:hypothetical protein TNCV_789401 [Trichonephila clavipes]
MKEKERDEREKQQKGVRDDALAFCIKMEAKCSDRAAPRSEGRLRVRGPFLSSLGMSGAFLRPNTMTHLDLCSGSLGIPCGHWLKCYTPNLWQSQIIITLFDIDLYFEKVIKRQSHDVTYGSSYRHFKDIGPPNYRRHNMCNYNPTNRVRMSKKGHPKEFGYRAYSELATPVVSLNIHREEGLN